MNTEERIPKTPPPIQPIDIKENRPRWSVMIPTYNCTSFLVHAIESVLAQDPGEHLMQIEVIDDCSTDADIAAVVAEVGKGRVQLFQQPVNRGSLRNFETCINRAKGEWVHLLHGDDMVKPGFYAEIEELFTLYPEAGAAFTAVSYINNTGGEWMYHKRVSDKKGLVDDFLYKIAETQWLQPPAIVVKRTVYEKIGSFFAVHYGEDWEMWTRIAAHYPVAYSPNYLAQYRNHHNNISSRYLLSGQNIKDINTVIEIIQNYLPEEKRKKLKRAARRSYSIYFAIISDAIYHDLKNPKAALKQAKMAIHMHSNKRTILALVKLYTKLLIHWKDPQKRVYTR